MRSKIATGRYPLTVPIDKIMSVPVITVVESCFFAEAQLAKQCNSLMCDG
jgi:CBS domain-containing protein